jgi:hypothetical protein
MPWFLTGGNSLLNGDPDSLAGWSMGGLEQLQLFTRVSRAIIIRRGPEANDLFMCLSFANKKM